MTVLQMKIDSLEKELLKEKEAHSKTKEEVETLEEEIERLRRRRRQITQRVETPRGRPLEQHW